MTATLVSLAKIGFAFALILQLLPVCIWLERKLCAYIQDRIGPNRAAILGLRLGGFLHNIGDVLKMLTKEDIRPSKVSPFLYLLGPFLVVVPPFLALAVIPWADDLHAPTIGLPELGVACAYGAGSGCLPLQIARLDVGVLYVFAVAGLSVFGIMLAGWASNNKYSLLGGLRSAAQLVSYEVALTLAAVGMMVVYGTVRVEEMIARQDEIWRWGIVYQPLAFVIFLIAIFAESNRLPFDLPEGESELVAGYHTEYTGLKFAIFMMAEYSHMIVSSAIISAIFLGGWQIPGFSTLELRQESRGVLQVLAGGHGVLFLLLALATGRRFLGGPRRFGDKRDYETAFWTVVLGLGGVGALVFAATAPQPSAAGTMWIVAVAQLMTYVAKILAFLFFYMWVRWTLPRFRFDQVMRLGWKGLMPLALLNVLATGVVMLFMMERIGPAASEPWWFPLPFAGASLVLLVGAVVVGGAAGRRRHA